MKELDEADSFSNISNFSCHRTSENKVNSFKTNSEVPCSGISDELCGEPFSPQYLIIDFTPQEDVDNDFVQKKCCEFWEFLNSKQELRHLMVSPENANTAIRSDDTSSTEMSVKSEYDDKSHDNITTAVSMLEIAEEKGFVDGIFETKMPQSKCSLGSREYHEQENGPILFKSKRKSKIKVCTCNGVCKTCKQKPIGPSLGSARVKDLCRKMTEWDQRHPKSMEPPGHPPTLIHSVMQNINN